jgi:glycine dehydrogenase subunit 1
VLEALAKDNIIGGYDLSAEYPELGNALLICATETKTEEDLQTYATKLAEIMNTAA